jgi:hypothetical protein
VRLIMVLLPLNLLEFEMGPFISHVQDQRGDQVRSGVVGNGQLLFFRVKAVDVRSWRIPGFCIILKKAISECCPYSASVGPTMLIKVSPGFGRSS